MNGATVDSTEALLAAFAEALRADDAASATIRGYVADVRRFAGWYERRLNVSLSEPYAAPDLAAWRSEMQDAGMAPAAINRVLAALRRFAAWREGAHQAPPLGRVRAVRVGDPWRRAAVPGPPRRPGHRPGSATARVRAP